MYHEHAFSFVVLLCAVVSVMLLIFFVYHMFMVKNGLTTNEKIKYSQVDFYLGKCEAFLTKWIALKEKEEEFKDDSE